MSTTPDTTTPHGGAPTLDAMAERLRKAKSVAQGAKALLGYVPNEDAAELAQAEDAAVAAALSRLSGPAADTAGLVDAVRPEVAAFALLMERELRANDHKGGWKGDDATNLAHRVCEEADELHEVAASYEVACLSPVSEPFKSRVGSEAADVANFCMMIADVCGCLDLAALSARPIAAAGEPTPAVGEKEEALTAAENAIRAYGAYSDFAGYRRGQETSSDDEEKEAKADADLALKAALTALRSLARLVDHQARPAAPEGTLASSAPAARALQPDEARS